MPIQTKNASEPIPGYRIRKRIGAGGYGEVWSADAPGGLQKAVKFVYGFLDDERATRELKSLNRIRGVRHPFLLSLERIEVVDGQLLIVTELADTSLTARYDECRKAGMQGIPRDELLGYLHDAADALDYMSETHSLQHLDVKPENLLLLSGRIKVADFGLVKDIGERSISMMGGLTPLYAAPEVYDGMPSRFSDQYSLAIVFQEMLTGTLPFNGASAAQLAMMHATGDPELGALSPRDQAIVEKALSKSPSQRFANCRGLIDHLVKGEALEPTAAPAIFVGAVKAEPEQGVSLEAVPEEKLGPPPVESEGEFLAQPTLFLGIGGLAGRVLQHLKSRLCQRMNGDIRPFPMLAIDTDLKALHHLQQDITQATFEDHEVVPLPLRRPEDYRNTSEKLLKWLSRRWLYNIPRSQTPEGRRPLGRLAFVDHAPRLFEALHTALLRGRDKAAIGAAGVASGLKFREGMRVVVVASISGATGSGMALDAAYAARQILAGQGVEDAEIMGFLPHAIGGERTARELAAVNAYAFLEEWYHYTRRGFPGDPTCGLQASSSRQPPFDDAYLLPLGERLSATDMDLACRRIADYLFINSVTECDPRLRDCRQQERLDSKPGGRVHLRTFGIDRLGIEEDDWVDAGVELLAKALAEYWQGRDPSPSDTNSVLFREISVVDKPQQDFSSERMAELDALVQQRAAKLALDVGAIQTAAERLVEAELGNGAKEFLRRVVAASGADSNTQEEWSPTQLFSSLRVAFGDVALLGGADKTLPALEAQLSLRFKSLAEACGGKAGIWLRRSVELPAARVSGARYLTRRLIDHLGGMEEQCAENIRRLQHDARRLERELSARRVDDHGRPVGPWPPSPDLMMEYAQLRMHVMIFRSVARFSQFVIPYLEEADSDLRDLDKAWEGAVTHLDKLSERVRSGSDAARAALSFLVGEGLPSLDAQSRRELIELSGRNLVYDAMARVVVDPVAVVACLRRAARRALMAELQNSEMACFPESGGSPRAVRMQHALADAAPNLRNCGGLQRLLVMLPPSGSEESAERFFTSEAGQAPILVNGAEDEVVMCYEVGQIPLLRAANALVGGRKDYIECASRVRTRMDVEWTNLSDSMPNAPQT